jgi:hypothetical protein
MVLLMLSACSGYSEVHSGGHTIYVHTGWSGGGMDAQVTGELQVRDGCVVLAHENDAWYPVVWPSGTTIATSDPLVVRLPSGDELAVGDEVIGGGGYLQPGRLEVDIPEDCLPPTREVAVFNANDDPTKN